LLASLVIGVIDALLPTDCDKEAMDINIRTDLALEAREMVGEEELLAFIVETEKSEQMT